jgi:uncharacterized membrane protein YkoI
MMFIVRSSLALAAVACLVATVWANKEEDKENEKKEHDTAKAVLAKAKIDLTKAIQTAQTKLPNGKPIEAGTSEEKGKHLFEVDFLIAGDKVKEVEVDAVTGEVVGVEDDEDEDADEIAEAKKVLQVSKVTFAQAIASAREKVKDGKAFSVELELENGKAIVEVELLSGSKVMKVEIDAATGKVLETKEEKE